MANKCIECKATTKRDDIRCFNCDIIVQLMSAFEKSISIHEPIVGKKRKLEIISYKITRL
jgi:hypothetical protein